MDVTKQTWRAAKSQVSCGVVDEMVVLDLRGGMYHGMNAAGRALWERLQKPATFAELVDLVTAQYEVTRKRAEADVKSFLERLVEAGLVE